MTTLEAVDDVSFSRRVLNGEQPTLVLFTAPDCLPCRLLVHWLPALARELEGRIALLRCAVESSPQTASRYGVVSAPTLLVFDNGELRGTHVGLWPLPSIRDWLHAVLPERRKMLCTRGIQGEGEERVMSQLAVFFGCFFNRAIILRACAVASVVAPVLLLLNHPDLVLAHPLSIVTAKKLAMNFAVPYLVSSYSAARTVAADRATQEGRES
jgi:thioredoxin